MNRILAAVVVAAGLVSSAAGADPDFASREKTIAAVVGGEPIYGYHVQEQLQSLLGPDVQMDKLPPRVVAEMLEQVVRQRLIEEFLVRGTAGLSTRDLDKAVEEARKEQEMLGKAFDEYLHERDWTEATFRKRLAWSLGWGRYLASQLTDERLQKYFEAHRAKFDGTQVEASHILLKLGEGSTDAERDEALAKAAQIRQLIVAGKMTFEAAAQRYSEAPSAASGGKLGSFTLRQMPPVMAHVAFDLEPGKVSKPLVSKYGVHLVLVTGVTPGELTWQQARGQIEPLVTKEIFQEVAAAVRKEVPVKYTDKLPHLNAAGKVVPASAR